MLEILTHEMRALEEYCASVTVATMVERFPASEPRAASQDKSKPSYVIKVADDLTFNTRVAAAVVAVECILC